MRRGGGRRSPPALAIARADIPGCGTISFTIGGQEQPALASVGPSFGKALAIAGRRGWAMPAK